VPEETHSNLQCNPLQQNLVKGQPTSWSMQAGMAECQAGLWHTLLATLRPDTAMHTPGECWWSKQHNTSL